MKRTTTANIAGIVFHIDEDAYEKLSRYIKKLKFSFGEIGETDETMEDFEARIAELFQSKLSATKQVITIEDVQSVIQTIGEPEEIETNQTKSKDRKKGHKTLFRDPKNVILGGVCSGIANYVGIDVWVIRLITLTFSAFWGFGVLLYILLWVIVPEAKTPDEYSQMSGETFDKEEFEKNIRNNIESVKQRFEELAKSDVPKQATSLIERFFSWLGIILTAFFSFIGAIIGFAFLITGLVLLVFMISILFFDIGDLGILSLNLPILDTIMAGGTTVKIVLIALFLIIIIPLFLLIAALIRALSGKKHHGGGFVSFGIGVWILAIVLFTLFFVLKSPFSVYEGEIESKSIIEVNNRDSLIIKGLKYHYNENYDLKIDSKHLGIITDDNKSILIIKPKLTIEKSNSAQFELKIQKTAQNTKQEKADENAQEIIYNYSISGDTLLLNTFFESKLSDFWQNKKLNLTLYVPEGKTIYLDHSLENNLLNINNSINFKNTSVFNKYIKQGENTIE